MILKKINVFYTGESTHRDLGLPILNENPSLEECEEYALAFSEIILNTGTVNITHALEENAGWKEISADEYVLDNIFYIGTCSFDGDMFMVKDNVGTIKIFKGKYNSGYLLINKTNNKTKTTVK